MNHLRRILPSFFAIAAVVGVVSLWCTWWRSGAALVARFWASAPAAKDAVPPVTLAELGQAGDLFGGFSALFSALAFVGVAVAAYLQRETILLQRKQIADATRDAVEAKAAADKERAAATLQQARQAFEPLFFQIVNLLRSQTEKMQLKVSPARDRGSAMMHFDAALADVRNHLTMLWAMHNSTDEPNRQHAAASEFYLTVYSENESHLGPYFRTLYHALKLIHRSGLPEEEKVDYANILRGLLTRDELLLVMLNCLSGYGAGLKAYIEIYGVLKHITKLETGTPAIDEQIATRSFAPTATMSWQKRKAFWQKHPMPQTVDV